MKLHGIADCLGAIQRHSGIQGGAEEVHSLLAVGVPAAVPLQDEEQKDGRGPGHASYLSSPCN